MTAEQTEAEVFEELLPWVRYEAFKFSQQYLADQEELESHANWIFHRAWITYKPSQGKFKSWLKFLLWKIWFEHIRRAAQRQARIPRKQMDLGRVAVETKVDSEGWLFSFFEELSEDARVLVSLTLDTLSTNEIKRFLSKKPNTKPFLERLRKQLLGKDWSGNRITKAFREVKSVL